MPSKNSTQIKSSLHPRNKNREAYDIKALIYTTPDLAGYVIPNKLGEQSIDFSNPIAVKRLNKAILKHYYGIDYWDFPDENLCPAIPGRADYIHHVADVLCNSNNGLLPDGNKITCMDIGVGANCVYPIIAVTEYDWQIIGSDVEQKSIDAAQNIINSNQILKSKVVLRLQTAENQIFKGILNNEDKIDLSICNPPFHSSLEAAENGTLRKNKNLSGKSEVKPTDGRAHV